MKKNLLKIFLVLVLLSPLSFGMPDQKTLTIQTNDVYAQAGQNTVKPNTTVSIKLDNPLGKGKDGIQDIPNLVKAILEIALKIGVPIIALAIIYTGYLFIAAQGKPEALQKAKESFVYVIIGSMILLGAYVIAESIVNTVNSIRGV